MEHSSPFDVDMSFSCAEIADIKNMRRMPAEWISIQYRRLNYYTSGYPFLVSPFCKRIDDDHLPWTIDGVMKQKSAS